MIRRVTLLALLMLGACSTSPSITNTNDVREIPPGYEAVSICHSGDMDERSEVIDLALSQCPVSTQRLYNWDQDSFMNNCPILKRKRVTFLCTM